MIVAFNGCGRMQLSGLQHAAQHRVRRTGRCAHQVSATLCVLSVSSTGLPHCVTGIRATDR